MQFWSLIISIGFFICMLAIYMRIRIISLLRIFSIIMLYGFFLAYQLDDYAFSIVLGFSEIPDSFLFIMLIILLILAEYKTYRKKTPYNMYNWMYWIIYLMYLWIFKASYDHIVMYTEASKAYQGYSSTTVDDILDILYKNFIFSIQIRYTFNFKLRLYQTYKRFYINCEPKFTLKIKEKLAQYFEDTVLELLKENPQMSLQELREEMKKCFENFKKNYNNKISFYLWWKTQKIIVAGITTTLYMLVFINPSLVLTVLFSPYAPLVLKPVFFLLGAGAYKLLEITVKKIWKKNINNI